MIVSKCKQLYFHLLVNLWRKLHTFNTFTLKNSNRSHFGSSYVIAKRTKMAFSPNIENFLKKRSKNGFSHYPSDLLRQQRGDEPLCLLRRGREVIRIPRSYPRRAQLLDHPLVMDGHLRQRLEGQTELGLLAAVHAHVAIILGLVTQRRALVVGGGRGHAVGGSSDRIGAAQLRGGRRRGDLLNLKRKKCSRDYKC